MKDRRQRPDRVWLGIVLVLASTFLTAMQEALIKGASSHQSLWQLYVLRSSFLIPMLLALSLVWDEGSQTLRRALAPWALVRSAMFLGMYFSLYAGIPFVALSTIAAGLYTAPLFIAVLTAVTGVESMTRNKWLGIVIGFLGVICILQPGTDAFHWLTLIPIAGGLFYAISGLVTRNKCQDTHPATLALSLSIALLVTGCLGTLVVAVFTPADQFSGFPEFTTGSWGAMDPAQWGVILALVALMFGNGLVLPAAYQVAPTTIVVTFDYSYLIFAALLGYLLFDEVPGVLSVTGMALIVVAGLMVAKKPPKHSAARI